MLNEGTLLRSMNKSLIEGLNSEICNGIVTNIAKKKTELNHQHIIGL